MKLKKLIEKNKMCSSCNRCFSDEEKIKLEEKGWTDKQIEFVEGSEVENKIKELI